jgi:hypothetical protein
LVKSYWPLMTRLKEAEAGSKQAKEGERAALLRGEQLEAEVRGLEARMRSKAELEGELARAKAELSIEAVPLPEGVLDSLHPDAVSARAYVRASQVKGIRCVYVWVDGWVGGSPC